MKTTRYFSHDINARHDPKISALLREQGYKGYGLYWAIVEMIAASSDYKLKKFDALIEGMAYELRLKAEETQEILSNLIKKYNLLKEDKDYIWSDRLLRDMHIKDEIIRQRSEWGKNAGIESGKVRKKKIISKETDSHEKEIDDIIDYFNEITKSTYKKTTQTHRKSISGRLNDGFTIDQCKKVIDIKNIEWSEDEEMCKYLTIETLFRPGKFEKYINQKVVNKEGIRRFMDGNKQRVSN